MYGFDNCRLVESGLKYRYHAAWCQVLGTFQVAFEVGCEEESMILHPL